MIPCIAHNNKRIPLTKICMYLNIEIEKLNTLFNFFDKNKERCI